MSGWRAGRGVAGRIPTLSLLWARGGGCCILLVMICSWYTWRLSKYVYMHLYISSIGDNDLHSPRTRVSGFLSVQGRHPFVHT